MNLDLSIRDRALELRSDLTQALKDILGTYELDGEKFPAFTVIRGASDRAPPDKAKVNGLEVVLFYPTASPSLYLGSTGIEAEWVLHLKQWDTKSNTFLAVRQCLNALADIVVKRSTTSPANPITGIPEVTRIVFTEYLEV